MPPSIANFIKKCALKIGRNYNGSFKYFLMKDASSSPREIMKGPDIKPCGTSRGTAPKKESQTDVEGTCCRLISHACSRSLYMRTVFGINQLSSIHACHFIRICIFPVINMSLIIESDPFYWLNWAYFVYGMQFLGIYFFKSHAWWWLAKKRSQ